MFKKVLFPTDFSKGAENAIKKFAKENQLKIKEFILLYIIDRDIIDEFMNGYSLLYDSEKKELADVERRFIQKAKEDLKREKRNLQKYISADKFKTIVKIGIPYEEIIKTADEEKVSVILLPSHGKLTFSHEVFGSVTMRVLRKTKRAVLFIKAHEEIK